MERRDFIEMLGLAGTSAAAYTVCSAYMHEALAQSTSIDELLNTAAHCQGGSLKDVEHVILLMQENRSFDHYYGTLRGVRGFGDPRPLRLKNGDSVFNQPSVPLLSSFSYSFNNVSLEMIEAIHGPNGYLFEFSENTLDAPQMQLPNIIAMKSADEGKKLRFVLEKWQTASSKLKLIDAYTGTELVIDKALEDKDAGTTTFEIATKDGWYDVAFVDASKTNSFLRRYAGHLENGKIGKSDPAISLEYDKKRRAYIAVTA